MCLELIVGKRRCYIIPIYKPPRVPDVDFISVFSELCDTYINDLNVTVLIGDMNFNMKCENALHDLCELYNKMTLYVTV